MKRIYKQKRKLIKRRLMGYFKKEAVLMITAVLALLSMFFVKPDQLYGNYIDVRTIALLFSLMAVTAGLREMGVFQYLAQKLIGRSRTTRGLCVSMILLCFFFSMVITNDVALITFVPFTLEILSEIQADKKTAVLTVVLETIAANLGSMLTPIGNPQNLYLYSAANMETAEFILLMLPYTVFSLLLLLACAFFIKNHPLARKEADKICLSREKLILYLAAAAVCLMSVVRVIAYPWAIVAALLIGLWDRRILKKIDYSLLMTFICLFILIGNLGRIGVFRDWIASVVTGGEMLAAVLCSQVISNVPAAVMLTGFTKEYGLLIIGTNIGGLGTLIASMASLISYKYYVQYNPGRKLYYAAVFTLFNLGFLVLLCVLWYLLGT